MRTAGSFELVIEPETDTRPLKVAVVLTRARPDENGTVQMTPECLSLDVLEGFINAMQDELDTLRADARRVFARAGVGHA